MGVVRRAAPVLLACVLAGVPPARADTASPKLAKYDDAVDESVDRALAWLANHQEEDGHFPGGRGKTTAAVGLCGMAFLSKGHMPNAEPYGEVIDRCIDFILDRQRENGAFDKGAGRGGMYAHCISTLFLSEASGMVDAGRQERIDKALPDALKLILGAQAIKKHPKHQGGWRYKPNSRDSDISVSGWALMALRSARLNGAPVPKKAIEDAGKYILRCRHKSSGGFAYTPGRGPGGARTGVALLCLELTGHHGKPVTRKAGDYLMHHLKGHKFIRERHFWYGVYYCSQGMFQLGNEYWETFAEAMYQHMLKRQHEDGYWRHGGYLAYPTAMSVLALTVSYRQLPIYQR
ncbi:MAG: prenyltransferase/squalene oxidase repeat-containing protein [Planctomycetota bacterium]